MLLNKIIVFLEGLYGLETHSKACFGCLLNIFIKFVKIKLQQPKVPWCPWRLLIQLRVLQLQDLQLPLQASLIGIKKLNRDGLGLLALPAASPISMGAPSFGCSDPGCSMVRLPYVRIEVDWFLMIMIREKHMEVYMRVKGR